MPGTNAGTGQPIVLKCAKCRRSITRKLLAAFSRGRNLEATGRVRLSRGHRGIRQTNRRIEYRCKDCGHVGWSQHIDAERLLRAFLDRDLASPSQT